MQSPYNTAKKKGMLPLLVNHTWLSVMGKFSENDRLKLSPHIISEEKHNHFDKHDSN